MAHSVTSARVGGADWEITGHSVVAPTARIGFADAGSADAFFAAASAVENVRVRREDDLSVALMADYHGHQFLLTQELDLGDEIGEMTDLLLPEED